jgi:glutamine synthetase
MDPRDADFLEQHPAISYIDLLVPDSNGLLRGKRLESAGVAKIFEQGVLLPSSVFGADISGDTVEETGLGFDIGDRDMTCYPVPNTLRQIPWAQPGAVQVLMDMVDDSGTSLAINPRTILAGSVAALEALGLRPVVAVELEFYLVDDKPDRQGRLQAPVNPVTGEREDSTQVYLMSGLDDFQAFINTAREYAAVQGIPASGAIAEYAPGQFEINLEHRDDPVAACDDAVMLKRVIKQAARDHGYTATFMAKPFIEQTGSGTHIHVSLYDEGGNNRFAADEQVLHHAVGGLQRCFVDGLLLCAPHANSFRRFQPDSYVPLSPCWGHNNRTVALRIPAGPDKARRIEHRLAGADANPYLLMALVLNGIRDGIVNQRPATAPIEGNAYEQEEPVLTQDWRTAIDIFAASDWVAEYFGEWFQQVYSAIKRAEYEQFQLQVTPLELQWYLKNA